MDVTSDTSVAEGFATILAKEPVDILIDNAGIMHIGMTEAYSVGQAHEQMDANYLGAIRAMQAVQPSMRATGSGVTYLARLAIPRFHFHLATAYNILRHKWRGVLRLHFRRRPGFSQDKHAAQKRGPVLRFATMRNQQVGAG